MREDQATGLRRLFRPVTPLTLGLVGHDATALALDLATAFANSSHRVLVLDRSGGEAARLLGLRSRYELRHVLLGDRAWQHVVLHANENIDLLPAMRGLAVLESKDPAAVQAWRERAGVLGGYDVVVCNGAPSAIARNVDWLLALSPTSTSLTAAYAELKRLVHSERTHVCRVVIDQARTERAALDAYASVAATARRFLGMTLELCGAIVEPQRNGSASNNGRGIASPRAAACTRLAALLTANAAAPAGAVRH
jgi:flagellar biosynthesis protein FlhG